MHIGRDRKNRGAEGKTYLSIVHNVWEKLGKRKRRSKPVVFAPLREEASVDLEAAESMRAAMEVYLDARLMSMLESDPDASRRALVERVATEFSGVRRPQIQILKSREFGLRLLLEPVWEELGLKKMLKEIEAEHRMRFPFERVVFGMVLTEPVGGAEVEASVQ
jgi:hypothetical protein